MFRASPFRRTEEKIGHERIMTDHSSFVRLRKEHMDWAYVLALLYSKIIKKNSRKKCVRFVCLTVYT
jgi:hypothetical protein